MGKKKNIPIELKKLIKSAVDDGLSKRGAAKRFGVSESAVRAIIKRYQERGSFDSQKSTGRKRKTTKREEKKLVNLSKSDPRKTAPELRNELEKNYGVNISVSTVQRRLRENMLFGRRPAKKPLISAKNRAARVKFAKAHLDWTPQQWSKVLWSDESKFMLFGSDGIKYIRRPPNTRFDPKYQLPTIKHGGGNVMVWGCFSRDSIGPIHWIKGIMDGCMYKDIIKDHMLPHAKNKMPRGWIFQQDNDPKHTSKVVISFFQSKKIRVLDWPSQSPDLNPIEHLWEHLDRQLKHRKPSNQQEFFGMIEKAWNEIDLNVLINLVDSMPRRCQAVIEAKGYATRY
jgi:transposase